MADTRTLAARIARQLGDPELVDKLAGLAPSALTSLLLAVLGGQARRRSFAVVRAQFARSATVRAAATDARALHALDAAFLAAVPAFEALELSPVAPLGLTALTGIDPNNVLAAPRALEVLADPTLALALEAARRRRRDRARPVRLCAASRVLRLQPFDSPDFTPHFRILALASAGRDDGGAFQRGAVCEHLHAWLSFLRRVAARALAEGGVRVELADTTVAEKLLERAGIPSDEVRARVRSHLDGGAEELLGAKGAALAEGLTDAASLARLSDRLAGDAARLGALERELRVRLGVEFPEVELRWDFARLHGVGYYRGVMVKVLVRDGRGGWGAVGDGGFVPWTQELLADRKERLLSTGLGADYLAQCLARGGWKLSSSSGKMRP